MNKQLGYYLKKNYKMYVMTGIGSIICGVSINLFLIPHHMLSGGISGIAMILYFLFHWPIGLAVALMNVPIFYSGYKLLDKEFVITGILGMVLFSVAIDATKFLSLYNITDDILLAAICGGAISGIGAGLVFRVGGNSGGLDVIALIIKKYYSLHLGSVIFGINCLLMVLSAFLFGFKPAMYTLISMFISSAVVDKVIEGFNRRKTITIIADNCDVIADAILKEIGRGVTFLHGEGAFTNQEKKVILVVVTLTQIAKVKNIIIEHDPKAFMFIQDTAEVSGRGFTLPSHKDKKLGKA